MDALDLLILMNTTYGLITVLKDSIKRLNCENVNERGLTALAETLEQNIYNIKVEYEATLNLP